MKCKYETVLFDLDGTLSRSGEGVRDCLRQTLLDMGCPEPDLSDYSTFIGPEMISTIKRLSGFTDDRISEALDIYKTHYETVGIYKNGVYDGIKELLTDLKASGVKLAVSSCKYEPFAVDVVKNLELFDYFDIVCGSVPDKRKSKAEIMLYAIKALGGRINSSVLIGDSEYDLHGAKTVNCDFIGVTYGYGNLKTMKAEGATVFADNADDLRKYLFVE
ncbi:MAG: HAD hydrolase-like protein [Bacillota bacterium]|nr:HAD hydrolase-like protein [Bacillota bacterium]